MSLASREKQLNIGTVSYNTFIPFPSLPAAGKKPCSHESREEHREEKHKAERLTATQYY